MKTNVLVFHIFCGALLLAAPFVATSAYADYIELSFGAGYTHSDFGNGSYDWSRRFGASVAYNFTERSGIEFSFSDTYEETILANYEDTSFHDQVYGLNWVQAITGRNAPVQPYFKGGVGLLNRTARGFYPQTGATTNALLDQITGILGVGMRIYLTRTFAIRGEATTYLVGGALSTWSNNFALTAGISLVF